jgi:tRNA A37 threonylcarbamoyladenosine synthetase subunit TsaC/SUA5/YrdC
VPNHPVPLLILEQLGEPIMSSTLLLPGDEFPLTDGREIQERLKHQVNAVIDGGNCGLEPTSVIDMAGDVPVILREGKGPIATLR